MYETDEFFARTKNEYMDKYIENYSAENFEAAVNEGFDRMKQAEDVKLISFEEKAKDIEDSDLKSVVADFKKLVKSIPGSSKKDAGTPAAQEYNDLWKPKINLLMAEHIGEGIKISDSQ